MPQEIKTICLSLPFKLGSVNCYLLKADPGYVLVDTGYSNERISLTNELKKAGCNHDNFKLILLTHGDFDHVGNAAYLRRAFGTKIAIHPDDAGMVEHGDMFWNRKVNPLMRSTAKVLFKLPPFRLNKSDTFTPDLYFEDGFSLLAYGVDARILSIPGHSKGSLGILTTKGDLFCGDLLVNGEKPALNSIIDDVNAANSSLEKLKSMRISTIYPGHGKPFSLDSLIIIKKS